MPEPQPRRGGIGVRAALTQATLPVKVVLVGVFISRLSGFLNLFLVLYLTSKGYSTEQAAAALSAYGAGAIVGVLAGGTLAQRLGPRNATVTSMAGTFLIMGSWLYLPSYPVLVMAAFLAAAVSQLYRPASATLLSDLTADNRQVMTFALYRFGLNLGATVAPLLGLGLYYLAGHRYNLVFWGEALIALGYGVLAWTTLPAGPADRPGTDPADGVGEDAATPGVSAGAADATRSGSAQASGPGEAPTADARGQATSRWASGYVRMLSDWRFTLYLLAIGLHSAVYVQYLSTLPLDIKLAGIAVKWYTFAVSLNGFIVIAFELLVTKITQSWPMRLSIALTLALLGVGVALYGLPLGPAVILSGTLVWSLGEIIGGPATFAYPGIASRSGLKPYYIGSFQFMFGLGTGIGPAIGGWLLVRLGHSVWPALALGSALATVLVLVAVHQPGVTAMAESGPEPLSADVTGSSAPPVTGASE